MKTLLFALSILALAISPSVARAQASHEYSPLTESTVNYKNFRRHLHKVEVVSEVVLILVGLLVMSGQ